MARSFTIFTAVFSQLQPDAFLNALHFHTNMLLKDADLSQQPDTVSISCFNQFTRMMKHGEPMICMMPLPKDHVEVYRAMTVKLVEAKELPESAITEFDKVFPFPQ